MGMSRLPCETDTEIEVVFVAGDRGTMGNWTVFDYGVQTVYVQKRSRSV